MNGGTKPDFASDILPLVLSWFAIPNFRACRPDGGDTQTPGPLSGWYDPIVLWCGPKVISSIWLVAEFSSLYISRSSSLTEEQAVSSETFYVDDWE